MSSKANRHDKVLRLHGHDWDELPQVPSGPNLPPKTWRCRKCGQTYVRNRRSRRSAPVAPCDQEVVRIVMES